MLKIVRAEEGRRCLCCRTEDNVKELVFDTGSGCSTTMPLCEKCRVELRMLLTPEDVVFESREQQRGVCEKMTGLLMGMETYLAPEIKEDARTALRILNNTGVRNSHE